MTTEMQYSDKVNIKDEAGVDAGHVALDTIEDEVRLTLELSTEDGVVSAVLDLDEIEQLIARLSIAAAILKRRK
jgi:hypothetical protein